MQKQTYFFSNRTKLNAILETPDFDLENASFRTVILCHGHSRHKNDGLEILSQMLVESGVATLRFDFSGCGENSENRYSLYCGTDWVRDLICAISFVSGFSFIDENRIGVAGISMGASVSEYVASVDRRIKSVVAMAGITDCEIWLRNVWKKNNGDYPQFLSRLKQERENAAATGISQIINVLEMYNAPEKEIQEMACEIVRKDHNSNRFVTMDSLASLLEFKVIDRCKNIDCPIFFIHGVEDELVPCKFSEEMYEAVASKNKKIMLYPNVDHNIPLNSNRDIIFKDIIKWFDESL